MEIGLDFASNLVAWERRDHIKPTLGPPIRSMTQRTFYLTMLTPAPILGTRAGFSSAAEAAPRASLRAISHHGAGGRRFRSRVGLPPRVMPARERQIPQSRSRPEPVLLAECRPERMRARR